MVVAAARRGRIQEFWTVVEELVAMEPGRALAGVVGSAVRAVGATHGSVRRLGAGRMMRCRLPRA